MNKNKPSEKQRTLQGSVSISGKGLHNGREVQCTLRPAPTNTGILFRRLDISEEPTLLLHINKAVENQRETSLSNEYMVIHTVEHVLAALMAMEIDNAIIEVDGDEIPILDGSARPFVEMFEKIGIQEQAEDRRVYRLTQPVSIQDGERMIAAFPSADFRISFMFDYRRPFMNKEYLSLKVTPESFAKELAPARTFCAEDEIEVLRDAGLIKGGGLENAVVFSEKGVLNQEGLYFKDESVRHKILDLIGDFALLGSQIRAHIMAVCSGHSLNRRLVRKIFYEKEKMFLNIQTPEFPDKDQLGIEEIKKILPHRYPFLLVDRILSMDEETQTIVGLKNVTGNEAFFQGHFPDFAIMPGVLIIEAMAQVGGILLLYRMEHTGKQVYFMGMDKVKFRKSVQPGDQVLFEVKTLKLKKRTGRMFGRAFVSGIMVAQAELKFAMSDE